MNIILTIALWESWLHWRWLWREGRGWRTSSHWVEKTKSMLEGCKRSTTSLTTFYGLKVYVLYLNPLYNTCFLARYGFQFNRELKRVQSECGCDHIAFGLHPQSNIYMQLFPWKMFDWLGSVSPDDIGGGQGGQEGHGQTKAEIIRPIPLNVGQPLVHLDP